MRIYRVPFVKQSLSAASDLFTLNATSSMAFRLHEVVVGVEGASSPEEVTVELVYYTGTPTLSGTSITPVKTIQTDAAATVTASGYGASTATGGTATIIGSETWQLMNGYQYLPVPEDRIIVAPSALFIVRLVTAYQAAHNTSATLTFEEIF